ncbi:MAG: zinc-dependent metalloprotease [Flavobacteriaceae bacterium]|nr:zinc-dependent metalloprotease [Flavobacteriaceae bacterium]
MKYILWIWALCLVPVPGRSQNTDHANGGRSVSAVAPLLDASLEGGRLFVELPVTSLDEPMLLTRIGRLSTYEPKQVTFRKSGNQMVLEETRIWSETGIWIALQNDPDMEKNILGVFPILEESVEGYRFDITDMLFDRSVGWGVISRDPMVPALNKLIAVRRLDGELMIKMQLGHQKKNAKIVQPVHYSFMKLPAPMEPRRFDYRMGFWNESRTVGQHLNNYVANIARWRLEKKHKDKKVSVPIKPITFTLSPDIPKKWRPYVKAGIEEWLPAFEAAGFKDAIVVKEVDSLDPWSAYSLGHSIVRWFRDQNIRYFGEKRNGATVTYVIDQRSGEMIKADVLLGLSDEYLMDEYFIRCAALDKRAQAYPFPDGLLGELIQSVTAHETGHALGIEDNNYGENQYPVEKMGDEQWLRIMGHTPSIMTYARHNNMAQPEDNIPPSLLVQKVGPTDAYYIRWAYERFPESMSKEQRADSLERIIRLQDTVPWYRFTNRHADTMGPAVTDQVVEVQDPIQGAILGLKNLERAMELLPGINRSRKDYVRIERIHERAISLWYHLVRRVFSLVGGYEIFYKSMEQPGNMFDPIPLQTQQEGLDYLLQQVFGPPKWLAYPTLKTHIRAMTYPDHLFTRQQMLLREMLKPRFMKRMQHMESIDGYGGIMKNYLEQLQNALFGEVYGRAVSVDPRKQGLQLSYIDWMKKAIDKEAADIVTHQKLFVHTDYTKGLMTEQLVRLQKQLEDKVNDKKDAVLKGHWIHCLSTLEQGWSP